VARLDSRPVGVVWRRAWWGALGGLGAAVPRPPETGALGGPRRPSRSGRRVPTSFSWVSPLRGWGRPRRPRRRAATRVNGRPRRASAPSARRPSWPTLFVAGGASSGAAGVLAGSASPGTRREW